MMNMKKLVVAAAVSAATALSVWSQNLDRIILHSGDTIKCNVMELSSAEVKFRYPAESLVNVEKMVLVKRIELASGRVIEGEKIRPVLSEADWERVVVTGDASMADGLKLVASIKAKSSAWRGINESNGDKAFVELKQAAARQQCHLVVLVGGYTSNLNHWTGNNDMEVRANIYTYPFIERLNLKSGDELLEEVSNRPVGSYGRVGYREYRKIMDDIEMIQGSALSDEKIAGIFDRIKKYRKVADSCPKTEKYDDSQFKVACQKLEKEFAKKCKRYGYSTTPEGK